MNTDRLSFLLNQYISGGISDAEKEELLTAVNTWKEDDLSNIFRQIIDSGESEFAADPIFRMNPDSKKAILEKILAVDKINHPKKVRYEPAVRSMDLRRWFAAASVFLLLSFAGYYFWSRQGEKAIRQQQVAGVDSSLPVNYVRNLVLPDGSTVILQAGSTLRYPASFNVKSREVELSGEAYFDITHRFASSPGNDNKKIPFTIHTGKIQTVVLGTSFNIKAYPGQKDIVVSVTRGKVRVESGSKILAVLTPDQQITYSIYSSRPELQNVDAAKAIDWTKADMEFDGVSFEHITQLLEKRYGVQIDFKNQQLRKCQIVSSFIGTESLQNVLETLCTIRNAAFEMETDKKIIIYGNGCDS